MKLNLKKILQLQVIFILLMFGVVFAQTNPNTCEPISKPTPHFGVHANYVFTNAWNMLNSGNWGSANMGNVKSGHVCVYLDTDGWTKANRIHEFGINIGTDDNTDFKFKVGDIMKCRYKGTKAQMSFNTNSRAVIQNESEADGYYTWVFRITRVNTDDNIRFNINGKNYRNRIDVARL
jgi:hypothetical protein